MAAFFAVGRRRYDEPLRHVGDLDADEDGAPEIARERFGEGLIELTLVPASDIVWVLRHEATDE